MAVDFYLEYRQTYTGVDMKYVIGILVTVVCVLSYVCYDLDKRLDTVEEYLIEAGTSQNTINMNFLDALKIMSGVQ